MRRHPIPAYVLALLTVACDSGVGGPSPTSPTPAALQTIAITGLPPAFAVEEAARLSASGRYSDGTTADVTAQVRWSTLSAACVIDQSGMLTAMAAETCEVEAALGDVAGRTSVQITSSKVFTISGVIRERWGPQSPGMRGTITIVSGERAGHRVMTEADGSFSIAGVPKGSVQVVAAAEDFEPLTMTVSPPRATAEFMMEPVLIEERYRYIPVFSDPWNHAEYIPFTITHGGPLTVQLSSNQQQCEISYAGVFDASWQNPDGSRSALSICVYGPGTHTEELTELASAGQYVLRVHMKGYSPGTTQWREVRLRYPGRKR